MLPVLVSSSFVPIPTLPCRTCSHSAPSILAVWVSCCIITVFVFRKPFKLYHIYICYTNIMLYTGFRIIRRFTYPWIRRH
jgi:hypothetical protein